MKQYQLKFCNERAHEIWKRKEHTLEQKHTTPGIILRADEKIALLRKKKVAMNKNINIGRYGTPYLDEVFNFKPFEREEIVNRVVLLPALAKLKEQYDQLTAEITLGDEVVALEMLKNFAK